MAANLDSRLAYIKLRRQGVDLPSLIDQKIGQKVDQKKEQVVSLVGKLASSLIERQAQASHVIDELLEDMTAHKFLSAPELQSQRLRNILEGLKAAQSPLRAGLMVDEQKMAQKVKEKQALEEFLTEQIRKLGQIDNKHYPMENELMEFGRRLNIYIAS